MSRLLVDDVTKTDARALLNVNKMATISDIVAPSNEYIYASGANELTVVEGCRGRHWNFQDSKYNSYGC